MRFEEFVTAVEATLFAGNGAELGRARFDECCVEWYIGALTLRLAAATAECVTLRVTIEGTAISPVSYAMTLRAARDLGHDLAALIDFPSDGTR